MFRRFPRLLLLVLSAWLSPAARGGETPKAGNPSPAPARVPDAAAVGPDRDQAYFHFFRAMDEMRDNRLSQAEESLRKAAKFDPRSAYVKVELARLLAATQNGQEAARILESCVQEAPAELLPRKALAELYLQALGDPENGAGQTGEPWQKAVKAFEDVLRIAPSDEGALLNLGKLFYNGRKLDEAERVLKLAVSGGGDTVDGVYTLAMVYIEEKKYAEALDLVKSMEAAHPEITQLRMIKAGILEKLDRADEAEQIYSSLVADRNPDPTPYLQFARLLLDRNKPEKAAEVLEKALDVGIRIGDVYDLLGHAMRQTHQFDKAVQAYKSALASGGGKPEYRYHLSLVYAQMGDTLTAFEMLQALLKELEKPGAGSNMESYYLARMVRTNLAYLLVEMGQTEDALQCFEKLVESNPRDLDASVYIQLSDIRRQLGQKEAALKVLDDAIKGKPEEAKLRYARTVVMADLGRGDSEVKALEERLASGEAAELDCLTLVAVHQNAGRWDQALGVSDIGLKQLPGNAPILFQKGVCLEKLKRYRDAEEAFVEIVKAQPDHSTAWNYAGYMLIDFDVDVDRGMDYVRNALKVEPQNAAYLDSLGWGYFKKKEYKEAMKHLLDAAKNLPADPSIHEHLGDLYRAMGRPNEAKLSYDRALASKPEADQKKRIADKVRGLKPKLLRKEPPVEVEKGP